MPRTTVRYFAQARRLSGIEHEELDFPDGIDAGEILVRLGRRHPDLAPLAERSRIAHNRAFARGPLDLADGDELALIPPVSGG